MPRPLPEDFHLELDESAFTNNHPDTLKLGLQGRRYVVFKAGSLTKERLEAIRRVAMLAYATNSNVFTFTHNNGDCSNATELSLVAIP